MEIKPEISLSCYGKLCSENLVVIGYEVKPYARTSQKGIGVGIIFEKDIIPDITKIGEKINIQCIVNQ